MPRKNRKVNENMNENINNEVISDSVEATAEVTAEATVEADADIMTTIARQIYADLHVDDNDYYTTIAKKDGTSVEIIKQVFKFKEPIGNRNQLTVMDKGLIKSIKTIEGAIAVNKKATYIICKELSNIKESGKLENLGFKTIGELAKALFGIESSTANHYAKIGELFITDSYEVNPLLPQLSVSHLLELDTYGDAEKVSELFQKGILSDGMSTKKIREVLKGLRDNALEDKGDNNDTDNTDNDTIDTDSYSTDNTTADSSDNSNQASATSTTSAEPTQESIDHLNANFDKQVAVQQMLNYCDVLEQYFAMLKEHDIEVVDYSKAIDNLKAMVKALV